MGKRVIAWRKVIGEEYVKRSKDREKKYTEKRKEERKKLLYKTAQR